MATRIAAPFPDVDLEEKSIIEVDTGNGALITRVVVHFTQDIPALRLRDADVRGCLDREH
jgi:hypothetical protein